MPRENKKRGRRGEEKKRKHEDAALVDGDVENVDASKRQKISDDNNVEDFTEQHDYQPVENGAYDSHQGEPYQPESEDRPFFGMLDEEEQEYFRKADDMLETNQFGDNEERDLFLANVYREAEGKELKLANSQSCSRLMERLIQLSSPQQLKKLFQKFHGK